MSKRRSAKDAKCLQVSKLIPFLCFIVFLCSCPANAIHYWADANGSTDYFSWHHGLTDNDLFGDFDSGSISDGIFKFTPDNFIASSSGNTRYARDRMQVDLFAADDLYFQKITINELGSYLIGNSGWVKVTALLEVFNLDADGQASGSFSTKLNSGDGNWTGTAEVDLLGLGYNWSNIRIVLTNTLIAYSPAGSSSYIQKDGIGAGADGHVNIEILIPEPTTLIIFGLGALLFIPKKASKNLLAGLLVGIFCVSFTGNAQALEYWTQQEGSFQDIQWNSGGSDNGLFGDPVLHADNTFLFNPSNFFVFSSDSIFDRLEFYVTAKPNYIIKKVGLLTGGGYEIIDNASIDILGYLNITDTKTGNSKQSNMAVTSNSTEWTAMAKIADLNLTSIKIVINNNIKAWAEDGSAAFAWNTYLRVPILVQAVPEPATVALLMMGLTVFIGRKK
ncbi:MAG: PEP-CTERM sorting domain-containing protein [Phycisphaerales bacterium]